MDLDIKLFQRPELNVKEKIIEIVELLTGKWFTQNVPEDTRNDLLFHDVFCLMNDEKLLSFIIFTSLDGSINITLMGTHPEHHGKGLGRILLNQFFDYVVKLGFKRIVVLTVPPDVKNSYKGTVDFYIKNGFEINRRYNELWEKGALELIKNLQ